MALLVLGHLRVHVMGRSADDQGHLAKPGQLGRAQTLRSEEDPVATLAAGAADDDGLKDAVHTDVGRELCQLAFRKLGSRIARILFKSLNGNKQRLARWMDLASKKSAWSGPRMGLGSDFDDPRGMRMARVLDLQRKLMLAPNPSAR